MNKAGYLYFIVIVGLLGLFGCSGQEQIAASEPVCVGLMPKELAMEAAEEALVKMRFVIEKYDTEKGLIITKPLRGAQFFEFWRRDNVGAQARAEASIHSIRRTAVLNFSGAQNQLCIKCDVRTERLSMIEEDDDEITMADGVFSGRSRQHLAMDTGGMSWTKLGTDAGLETKILGRIKNTISKTGGGK